MFMNICIEIFICPTNEPMMIVDEKGGAKVREKKVSFRLDLDLWQKVLDYCEANHMRPSAVIRAALLAFFTK